MSFSIRDEDRKKVVLRIAKPHSPVKVLRMLFGRDLPLNHVWSIECSPEFGVTCHGYVGLSDENAMQWIFLNHKPICYPLLLRLIKIAFKERLNLFPDQESNARDPCDKNMFILFFLTFSQKEFTFVTESGKRYIMFYDMRKILNIIKNCVFKCLGEEATAVSAITPYSRKTQLLKRIYLKSERSVFSYNINGRKNITSSMMKKKIVGFKRKQITSVIIANYFNKQHKECNNESIKYYTDKTDNVLNNIHCQIASIRHTNFCEDKAVKKPVYNGVDKMQSGSMNFDTKDNSTKSDQAYNYHDGNNNNFKSTISPLSEWSNWTYYTNNKKRDPARNMNEMSSENDIRYRQFFESNNQFDFLPRKLHCLLQRRHVKLTNVKYFNSPNDTIPCK